MKWAAIIVAILIAAAAATLTFSDSARLVVGLLLSPLFDPGPPSIFSDKDCTADGSCSTRFNALLHQQFPPGTPAKILEEKLSAQGFHHLSSKIKNCTMPGDAPEGVEVIDCPKWDSNWNPRHYLEYHWGSGPCGRDINVLWSEDRKGRIAHLEGGYNYACL